MTKIFTVFVLCGLVLTTALTSGINVSKAQAPGAYDPFLYGSPLSVSVGKDGLLHADGARVEQLAGKTALYTKLQWGLSVLRLTVRIDGDTKVIKKNGQGISPADIQVGDYISVDGEFIPGTTSFDVQAKNIKVWSIQTEGASYSGTITGTISGTSNFTLDIGNGKTVILTLTPDVVITRGSLTVNSADIMVGKKITLAQGVLDQFTNVLTAYRIKIYEDMSLFTLKTFEGKIVSTAFANSPATMVVAVGDKNYTVTIGATTKILQRSRAPLALARFLAGDSIRFSGYIQESDHTLVKATAIRNMDI